MIVLNLLDRMDFLEKRFNNGFKMEMYLYKMNKELLYLNKFKKWLLFDIIIELTKFGRGFLSYDS